MFSNMFGIFGRKADDTTTQESIQKLLDMEALLMKKQAYLEGKIKEVRYLNAFFLANSLI